MFDYTITPYSKKSHRFNEDRCIIGSNYAVVIDVEATVKPFGDFASDGVWFASFIKKNLKRYEEDVLKKLTIISSYALKEYIALGGDENKPLPVASIAVFELENKKIKLSYIGNTEIAILGKDGSLKRMREPYFSNIDEKANQMMRDFKKDNKMNDMMPYQVEIEKKVKQKYQDAIKDDMAFIYAPLRQGKFIFKVSYFDPFEIKTIYMYTDGFADAYQVFKIYKDFGAMFKHNINVSKVIFKIIKNTYLDTFCSKYPRYKVVDDISVIKIDVNY